MDNVAILLGLLFFSPHKCRCTYLPLCLNLGKCPNQIKTNN